MGSGKRRPLPADVAGAHDLLRAESDAQQSMVVCIRCHRILPERLCAVLREGGREWACCNQCAPNDALRVVQRARSNWRYHLSDAPRQSKASRSISTKDRTANGVCTNCGAMVLR